MGRLLSVTIKQKNPQWLKELQKRHSGGARLAVGYPTGTTGTSTKYPDGTPVALVAAANNFGAPSRGIPARNFMDVGAVLALEKTGPTVEALVKHVNSGKITLKQLLAQIGPTAAAAFQKAVVDFSDPANSPATIAKKGSSNPLVDTGLLNTTLTYIVRTE